VQLPQCWSDVIVVVVVAAAAAALANGDG